jgi:hypothetical protein
MSDERKKAFYKDFCYVGVTRIFLRIMERDFARVRLFYIETFIIFNIQPRASISAFIRKSNNSLEDC